MPELIQLGIQYGGFLLLLVVTYFIGSMIERRHFRKLRLREEASTHFPCVTFRSVPSDWQVTEANLVTGSVVVSLDYFKRFLAGLRGIVGGRIRSYETLLDRARREAIMRMKDAAHTAGYSAIINVRLETSRLASTARNGEGTAGVEILAFGTAIKLAR